MLVTFVHGATLCPRPVVDFATPPAALCITWQPSHAATPPAWNAWLSGWLPAITGAWYMPAGGTMVVPFPSPVTAAFALNANAATAAKESFNVLIFAILDSRFPPQAGVAFGLCGC